MSPLRVALVPSSVASLQPFVDAGVLSAVEVQLAEWTVRASGVDDPHVVLAVAMAVWAVRNGHVCATLPLLPAAVGRNLASRLDAAGADLDTNGLNSNGLDAALPWPDAAVWAAALQHADPRVVRVVDTFDEVDVFDPRPLVVHGNQVYLQRHWLDECAVAASVQQRALPTSQPLSTDAAQLLEQLLPAQVDGVRNLQRSAADAVVANRLAVVVGGPGTGKTYSVARLLAVLLQQAHHDGQHLRIALAAPTGKAAARLQESIAAALHQGDVQEHSPDHVRVALASVVPTTIHRLLGPLPQQRQRFRYHGGHPLPHDVVVIDETSMVSLPLLARLLEAVRPDARLVLIGDPDQLESVELGAVLGDLVAAEHGPLHGRVVRLLRGHRFGGDSPIALLSDAVRDGQVEQAVELFTADAAHDVDGSSVRFVDSDDPMSPATLEVVRAVVQPVLHHLRAAAQAGDAAEALRVASSVRILCAHRHGRFGVSEWNRVAEAWLTDRAAGATHAWYAGRPLLVTSNDTRLGLSNGDTGVVVVEGDRPVAVFMSARGVVRFDPAQLDDIDTAYAMTVHKSQGSEYDTVIMVLPPARSPLAGRELVYTGATRAKRHLFVVGNEAAVRAAVASPATRMTGLAEALA
jgi:exodeoxyribonuclease V alpha subunit